MFKIAAAVLMGVLGVPAAWAQQVLSARSGLVHYLEGDVRLGGDLLKQEFGQFPQMKPGDVISVDQGGRVEVLLGPGSILRLGSDSSAKLLSDRITDTQLAILTGTALIEVAKISKDANLTVDMGTLHVDLVKSGLYQFNAETGEVRVYDGKAETLLDGKETSFGKGRTVALDTADVRKFKTKEKSDLYLWSQYRSQLLALANVSSARNAQNSRVASDMWVFNSYYGLYTFLLRSGTVYSPFGWGYYSPRTIWIIDRPVYVSSGWGDASTQAGSWGGLSSRSASSGSSASVPSAGVVVRSDTAPASAPAPAAAPAASAGGRGR